VSNFGAARASVLIFLLIFLEKLQLIKQIHRPAGHGVTSSVSMFFYIFSHSAKIYMYLYTFSAGWLESNLVGGENRTK
jgi:hypothetical protein